MWIMLLAYLVMRVVDLIWRGALPLAFEPSVISLMFWLEMLFFIAPAIILANPANRRRPDRLLISAVCLLTAALLLRVNAALVGYLAGPGWSYFPSLPEIMVSVGIVAAEILGYIVLVRWLPIMPKLDGTQAAAK